MKKRSRYRPKGVLPDPLNHVLSGLRKVASIGPGVTLMIKQHSALDALRRGEATREDFDYLIEAFNMMEALACLKYGRDWEQEIQAAQRALLEVGRRGVGTGKFVLRSAELAALNLGMQIHDAQLEACTVSDMEKALDLIAARIRSGKAQPIVRKEKDAEKEKETH